MSEHKPKLADYLEPDTSDMRVNRLWANVASAQRSRQTGRWVLAGALLAAGVATVSTWWVLRPPAIAQGTEWHAVGRAETVTLAEATMELAPSSVAALEISERAVTRLRLQNGRALFDVVHREGRRFEVVAGERVVRVVGTRFTVTRAQDEVVVEVERGLVEVDTPSGVVRLTAGQRWPALEAAAQSPEPPQPTVGLVEPVTEPEVDQPASTAEAKKKRRAAPKASARPPEPVPVEPLPTAPAPPTAAELFSAAIDARRSGKAPEAVAAFERFLTAFPSDPRAPLAHFELGRLKMDSLKDPKGAVTSLERALASPAAEFREEATSRLVRAFDALGRLDDCRRVKADYLSRWPSGSYVQSLNGRCQER